MILGDHARDGILIFLILFLPLTPIGTGNKLGAQNEDSDNHFWGSRDSDEEKQFQNGLNFVPPPSLNESTGYVLLCMSKNECNCNQIIFQLFFSFSFQICPKLQ